MGLERVGRALELCGAARSVSGNVACVPAISLLTRGAYAVICVQVVRAAGRAVAVPLPPRGIDPTAAAPAAAAAPGSYGGGGVALMREATYALADLELQAEGRGMAAAVAAAEGGSSSSSSSGRGSGAAAGAGTNDGNGNGGSSSNGSGSSTNLAAELLQRLPSVSVMDLYDRLAAAALRASSGLRGGSSGSSSEGLPGTLAGAASSSTPVNTAGPGATSAAAGQHTPLPPRASDVPYPLPASATVSATTTTTSSTTSTTAAASAGSGSGPGAALLGELGRAVKALRAGDRRLDQPDTVLRLKRVLETYTDVTRYPK